MLKKIFRPSLTIALILVYVVIIAGAVVRMTGSGMGCPDWPKCFGYLVPPTNSKQLKWQPNHEYKKNQVIILNESLRVANHNFTSAKTYIAKNWNPYSKHDYAIFNPIHTWVEYINRLATVLFGIPILLLVICSLSFWKTDKRIFSLALLALLSVGFEAWLGKIVVDTNLQPIRITLHVLFVFFIVGFLLSLRFITKTHPSLNSSKLVTQLGIFAILLTIIQVIIGTQLRQYVDVQMDNFHHKSQENWLQNPPFVFYIHRSFSILLLIVNGFWLWMAKKKGIKLPLLQWVGIFIILEAITGIILYYLSFPFLSQPIHLLLSSLLFSVQFFCVLRLLKQKK